MISADIRHHYDLSGSLLRFAVLLFIPFTVLTLAAASAAQPPHAALAGFGEGCASTTNPCWQRLVVGFTSVGEAHRRLVNLGYEPFHRSSYGIITYGRIAAFIDCDIQLGYNDSTGPIQTLIFENCNGLRLGDFEDWLGVPGRVMPEQDATDLIYSNGSTIILVDSAPAPESSILQVRMRAQAQLLYDTSVDWRGHLLKPWYCRDQFNQFGAQNC
jgi:hypothetical protein